MTRPTLAESAPSAAEAQPVIFMVDQVLAWFASNARDLPWRRPGTPAWQVLVSEVMLQQTPVARVLPRYIEWLTRWPTPADLAESGAGDAIRMWGKLGYPRRALALHACAVAITERYDGQVPANLPALLSLPGVGRYTARAVLAFAFGQRAEVVDTNVRRVLARAVDGAAAAGPPSTTRDLAAMAAVLPAEDDAAVAFCAAIMELGALVCTAATPKCDQCPIARICTWRCAGKPAWEGPVARRAGFVGTDRQARGRLLDVLRASTGPVTGRALELAWPATDQQKRALAGLLKDGLIQQTGESTYRLPS